MAGFGAAFAAIIIIILTPIIGGLLTLVGFRLSANKLLNRKYERRFASLSKERESSQTFGNFESTKLNNEINKRKKRIEKIKSEFKLNKSDIRKIEAKVYPYFGSTLKDEKIPEITEESHK